MGYILRESWAGTGLSDYAAARGYHKSQSFTSSLSQTIGQVRIVLKKSGAFSPVDFKVSIYLTAGDHKPTGEALVQLGVFSTSDLTGSYAEYTFNGGSVALDADIEYAIVIEKTGGGTDGLMWDGSDEGVSDYPGGTSFYKYNDIVGWVAVGGDRSFEEYHLESLPSKPINPTPTDTGTEIDFSDYTISWEDGGGADTYNVYFGDIDTPVFLGNQAGTTKIIPYTTDVDEEGVTHAYVNGNEISWNALFYWRIDAVNDAGTTTGDVWTFDARPAKVTNPGPADVASDIKLYPEYSWDASTVATSYDLYVGIGELMGAVAIDVPGITDTSYDSAVVDFQNGYVWGYNSVYYWRVDAVNDFGTTEGDVWTFNSIDYAPPLPTGVTLTDVVGDEGEPTGTPTGENNMITVRRLVAAANNTVFYEDE